MYTFYHVHKQKFLYITCFCSAKKKQQLLSTFNYRSGTIIFRLLKYKYILQTLKPRRTFLKIIRRILSAVTTMKDFAKLNNYVKIWIPLFNSPLSLLQARKLETHTDGRTKLLRRTGSVCTFDARYTRACTRAPAYNRRVEVRQKGDINFRHRVSRPLCVRRCALCRSPLVNRVGAFLIYVCASPENAIGKSRASARRGTIRALPRSERKRAPPRLFFLDARNCFSASSA